MARSRAASGSAMPAELNLRPPRREDAGEIARLSAQLGYPADAGAMEARLAALLPREAHFLRVADAGDRLAGWIAAERRCVLESGESIEIVGLVVDAAARRGGVGRQLVAAVEDWARSQGLALVVRSNVLRTQSHPFYEGLGFVRDKTQHVYKRRH